MSASAGYGKSKSRSDSPFMYVARDLLTQIGPKLTSTPPPYAGVPSTFDEQGPNDILTALMGGAPNTSPLTGAGQTTQQLLETGLPADTTQTENALDAVRQRTLAEESANLKERSGIAGSRFSTGYLGQEGELSRKSLQDYFATVAPLRYGAAEAAAGRRAGAVQNFLQAAIAQRGLRGQTQALALSDQRARELGYLPYILQLLTSIGPSQNQNALQLSASGGKGGGGGSVIK